jgi:hypothetical protein
MKKEYDFSGAKRGPVVPAPPGKTRASILLDDDVLEWFRSQVHEMGGVIIRLLSILRCVSTYKSVKSP